MEGRNSRCKDDDQRGTKKAKAGVSICDDVLPNIFARLPARAAMRCAALSKRHRRLICDPDFWLLHRRVSPPPPRPHIAYMVTSTAQLPSLVFHEFHLAGHGGGGGGGTGSDLRRALIERQPTLDGNYLRYVGPCNGIVLVAPRRFHGATSVVLFNPALAGGEDEVVVEIDTLPHLAPPGCYRVAGIGYGPIGRRHKLLVARVEWSIEDPYGSRQVRYNTKELLVCSLGGLTCPQQWRRAAVLTGQAGTKISGKSVYLDGKIYLLADHSWVFAFAVDDETVTAIDLPGELAPLNSHAKPKLMEMSGRLCVAAPSGNDNFAIWSLTADQHRPWERRCLFRWVAYELAGGWDCGGVVLLFFPGYMDRLILHLYDTRTHTLSEQLHVPCAATGQGRPMARRVFCWGYQPTALSPGSIVGAPPPRKRGGGLLAALRPVIEQDVRTGRENSLHAVCFVDMLLYIMRQLPDKASDVLQDFNREPSSCHMLSAMTCAVLYHD
ncbi:hypothetical protein ACP70R_010224 [Stipagrostis hirtigluma subsp. patula]